MLFLEIFKKMSVTIKQKHHNNEVNTADPRSRQKLDGGMILKDKKDLKLLQSIAIAFYYDSLKLSIKDLGA